jgi:hypothetical protein
VPKLRLSLNTGWVPQKMNEDNNRIEDGTGKFTGTVSHADFHHVKRSQIKQLMIKHLYAMKAHKTASAHSICEQNSTKMALNRLVLRF